MTLRVLVAEDSPTARALLVHILGSDPGVTVVGEARNGQEAVAMAEQLRPDVITMDVEMPGMDGLEATKLIMTRVPTPIVVVSGSASLRETALSLDATEAGALCLERKPASPSSPCFEEQCAQLLATVKSMAQVKVVRRWARSRETAVVVERGDVDPGAHAPARVVAIGASTGGPAALHALLRRLPADFGAPVLVVQHIAPGFTGAFASWLGGGCRLRVKLAEHGERLAAGTVYVAPDGYQLGVGADLTVVLDDGPPVGGFRPSATSLFESVARRFGSATVAVILSGMGGDGVAGLREVHAAGGRVLAQDERSSVVYGMPREAVRAGVVTAVLDPPAIGERLLAYIGRRRDANEHARR